MMLPDNVDFSSNIQKDKEANINHKKVDGIEYTVVNYKKDLNKLIWDKNNIEYKIDGSINENEIFKIAKSMK